MVAFKFPLYIVWLCLVQAIAFSPARAQEQNARGLFFEQLDSPRENLNVGLSYWIELRRNSRMMRSDNLTTFKSGDHIRIHIEPNVAGYAYVVLLKGSTGKKSVLFPPPGENMNNQVSAGRKYTLPYRGYFVFDKNPGEEIVRVAVSRKPVTAATLLHQSSAPWAVLTSSITRASLPEHYLVTTRHKDIEPGTSTDSRAKDLFYEASRTGRPHVARVAVHRPTTVRRHVVQSSTPALEPASVIIINNQPQEELLVDIILSHQK